MSRKAYKKTRRNQLDIRLKRCEESFRKAKKLNKEALAILRNPEISDKDAIAKTKKIDEAMAPYLDTIKHFGL
jgi:hypothetical protein